MPYRELTIPTQVERKWQVEASGAMLTAPVVAGNSVFVGDRKGAVQAIDSQGQEMWKAFTGGAIYFPPVVAQGRVYVGSADGWVYALEATSGRRLWRFRVGPSARRIPVYGKLISTWPVAGGVIVRDGVVYAAAGIAHYDGTYVAALDAVTGKVKWYNDTSGTLSQKVNSGVSLQGSLWIQDNELRFTGGGVYQTARYALDTGKCLNTTHEGLNSRYATAFYAYFPKYGQYPSLHYGYPDGKLLQYNPSYEGSRHTTLALKGPILKTAANQAQPAGGADRPRDGARRAPQRNTLWQEEPNIRYKGFVVTPKILLAAAVTSTDGRDASSLLAINIEDGRTIWRQDLPAPVVKDGLAVDSQARIVAALENGQVVCLQ
jgi:outer membrane protein assembly factor BamB